MSEGTNQEEEEMANRIQNNQTVQQFSEITIPEKLRTSLKTGWEYIDVLFTGDGIRPSTCCMLTGLPGAGKTTISLQIADYLISEGHTVFYNSCEESGEQLKMTLERLGLQNMLDKGYHASLSEIGEILDTADKLRANVPSDKGFFLFLDSLQTVEKAHEGRGRPLSQQNMATEAMWQTAEWCKQNMTVAIVIGQVTKDGTFAGKQEVKHAIDCHLHLSVDTDKKSDTYKQRVAEMQKNRFGSTGTFFPYDIDSSGITFQQ